MSKSARLAPSSESSAASVRDLGSASRRALLVALALGVVGSLLLMLYLRRYEEEVSGGGRVSVVTVRRPIARGALVTADMLTTSDVPLAYVEQRAIRASERDKVLGVRTSLALSPQDTLMWSDLALSSEHRDLSSLVQNGKRGVTVRASEAGSDPAGNGLVQPGDYVDVIVTLRGEQGHSSSAIVLLQRVLVLAVGSTTEPQHLGDGREHGNSYGRERELTLSLKVEEVQLLSLARERGTLSVALRGPNDSKVIEGIADVPLSSLYDKVVRETVQRKPRSTEAAPVRVTDDAP